AYRAVARDLADSAYTAVFAATDELANGAIAALADAGLRVPSDVSVVGFDDMPEVGEDLTTVRQDIAAIARTAVELLHEALNGAQVRALRVPVSLVVRGTTAERRGCHQRRRPLRHTEPTVSRSLPQRPGKEAAMRRVLLTFAVLGLLVGMAQAQTVRIMGYGGSDPAVVQRLLDEVVGAQLAGEGITVHYEPIETDYNQVLTNALSAGTAADVFYIPGETAPGIIATGKVLPITDLVDTSPFIPSLMEVY